MSKYNNRITEVDGICFHSAAEARRYGELKLLQQSGEISDLKLQPRFLLIPAYYRWDKQKCKAVKVRATYYIADFSYRYLAENVQVVEDVKGAKTDVYQLKRKLFETKYPDYAFEEVAA